MGLDSVKIGSIVRVQLAAGDIVKAKINAVTQHSSGRKLEVVFGPLTALVSSTQIIEILRE